MMLDVDTSRNISHLKLSEFSCCNNTNTIHNHKSGGSRVLYEIPSFPAVLKAILKRNDRDRSII